MQVAKLPQPRHEIVIKMLVALRSYINGFSQAKTIHGHRRTTRIEIFRVSGQDLAALWLNQIAPEFGGMQMAGWEGPFKGEMIFFTRRQLIKFEHLQAE